MPHSKKETNCKRKEYSANRRIQINIQQFIFAQIFKVNPQGFCAVRL